MRKMSYFVVGLLIFSSFAAVGIGKEAGVLVGMRERLGSVTSVDIVDLGFSKPVVTEISIDGTMYVELEVEGVTQYIYHPGEPILPIYTTILSFPFGTRILNVECEIQDVETMSLSEKIVPAPQLVILNMEYSKIEYIMDDDIYNSEELFPDSWVSYSTGGGRDENKEPKTFLTIKAYPVRYSPAADTINYISGDAVLKITYEEPNDPITFPDEYDMVIITPLKFVPPLLRLALHKSGHGVRTTIKTVESIYRGYSGVDKPEQIKYFIKDARETWGVDYVLLVGGLNSLWYGRPRDDLNQGTKDWWLPVRYTNLKEDGYLYDPGYISDLYYADLYDSEGDFDSWDSNEDGYFANWGNIPGAEKDIIDLYPDVYVGRLPCRNKLEVRIMVNKIINYEKGVGEWYDKMICVAGDSFPDYGTDYFEGEVICDLILERYMDEFTPVRLYASNKDTDPSMTPEPENIIREISNGSGHLLFMGHGNPYAWSTLYPGEFYYWAGGIRIYDFPMLINGRKLPVCVVGGSHNSMFNVSLLATLRDGDNSDHMWCYGKPVPECWSWHLTRKIGGGSIATIGNTGLAYGVLGSDCIERYEGFLVIQFYKTFNESIDKILGECWGGAVTKYMDTFPPMAYKIDAKTVEQWVLLGDPSLKIGGYTAGNGLSTKIVDAESGVVAALGETITFNGMASNGKGECSFEWDFDDDGEYDDATGQTVTWSRILPGVYWVSLKVTDGNGDVDTYDTVVGVGDWLGIGDFFNNLESSQQSNQNSQSSSQQSSKAVCGLKFLQRFSGYSNDVSNAQSSARTMGLQ